MKCDDGGGIAEGAVALLQSSSYNYNRVAWMVLCPERRDPKSGRKEKEYGDHLVLPNLDRNRSCITKQAFVALPLNAQHNGRFHETPVIRLRATKSDSKTSSRGHRTFWFYSFSYSILDLLAGRQGKPVHWLAAFRSILQNTRGSKKFASIRADG